MRLYWGPRTCAIGTHIILEEIGKPYETVKVETLKGESRKPPFSDVNPKGKVPTLVRDDGSVLTEYGAIALWLARSNPEKNLLPTDPEREARQLEMISYIVDTLQGQAFARIFVTERALPPDALHSLLGLGKSALEEKGREMAEEAFRILERQLAGRDYVEGDHLTIADSALFFVERWALQAEMSLPPTLDAHLTRMKSRPAVQHVMAVWGET